MNLIFAIHLMMTMAAGKMKGGDGVRMGRRIQSFEITSVLKQLRVKFL